MPAGNEIFVCQDIGLTTITEDEAIMTGREENAQSESRTKALLQAIEKDIPEAGPSGQLPIQQALERLIVSAPLRAVAVILAHQDDCTSLESAGHLGALLLRTLMKDKQYGQAVILVRAVSKTRLLNEVSLLTRLGRALLQGAQMEAAQEVFQAALAMDPMAVPVVKGLYECAAKSGQVQEADKQLERLLVIDHSFMIAAFVAGERQKSSLPAGRPVRIALLSSYVLDWVLPYLDAECRRSGLSLEAFQAPFNQYTQEVFLPTSELYRFQPEVVFLSLAIDDLFPQLDMAPKEEELNEARSSIVDRVLSLVREMESRCGALIVVHEFVLNQRGGYGILDTKVPHGVAPWVVSLNAALALALKSHERAFILPMDVVTGWVGKEKSYSPKLAYMASMKLAEPALPSLAKAYMRYVKPLKGLTRKCVVLDLDGTLWGGVVGELGVGGVSLGPSAPGIEYVDFQRALFNLMRRGILLAICSKNNPEDALLAIRTHPHMVLREEHFSAMRINWKNKAENIREIAQELNIGLDSLVFLDDNPNERELVKQLLPEVLTIELPRDPSLYRRTVEEMTDFELLALTKEDEMRVAQYQANSKRQSAKQTAASLEEYLRSLEISVSVGEASRESVNRLVQLFNKTNQFNLTTKRYQLGEVEGLMQASDAVVYDLHVKDRFGDHGLVGASVVRKEQGRWRIDSLLMSCRVMGLGIETAFLGRVVADAMRANVETIIGDYAPTKKNIPVKEFYAQQGFHLVKDEDGRQEWALSVALSTIHTPGWVCIIGREGKL